MSTKVAIMQPYLFPYFGYFQLIAASDVFVIYDDTQYIGGGWINRNRILINGKASLITLPIKSANFKKNIRDRYFVDNVNRYKKKMLNSIHFAYARAPFFEQVFALIEEIINFSENNVAVFIENSLRKLCKHLGISTPLLVSSRLGLGQELSGKDRLIRMVNELGANNFINPIGGFSLYSCEEFMRHGIALKFIKMDDISYRQLGKAYLPNLSIIDLLMFVELVEVQERLHRYSLIDNFNSDTRLPVLELSQGMPTSLASGSRRLPC